VCPDGTWRASDELGSTIALGVWTQHAQSKVVRAQASGPTRSSAKDKRRDEMFCRAVIGVVHAMGAHDE
jgi:hypothetical protein